MASADSNPRYSRLPVGATTEVARLLCGRRLRGAGPDAKLPGMKVKKLLHTRYRLNDLEKSVQFYTDILGLEVVRKHESPRGSKLVFLKTPGSEELIELCHFPNSGPVLVQADLTHLAFEVDSLEAFGQHLAKSGLKYSDGPTMKPDGAGGFAFIDAPEGYEIELIQRPKTDSKTESY